jgi:hypothetical protein
VCLNVEGNAKAFNIHRVVALAFIPNPNNFGYVLHIDNNKINNHYKNLKWGTQSQNIIEAIRDGLMRPYWLGRKGNAHGKSTPVIAIKDTAIIEFSNQNECGLYIGRSRRAVGNAIKHHSICNGFRIYNL